ncbi:ATP-dependent protease ATPase subunit HslU [bacterium]|nr:ATP-dependent protease ATPase subunit HslU [candidate division CSSED10-310 bacterium]
MLTPPDIVDYLDRFIIGQQRAKRAVAIALRNRWRRRQLTPEMAEEIIPKNILIIGPTGVGKTEIARRIARLTHSPFIKVEASKFTEVGYVGRDVESIIRDLTELSVNLVKSEHKSTVHDTARSLAEERLLDLLLPPPESSRQPVLQDDDEADASGSEPVAADAPDVDERSSYLRTREKFRQRLRMGKLDDRHVEMDVQERHGGLIEVFSSSGVEEIGMQIRDMVPGLFNQQKKRRKMTVEQALRVITDQEESKLVDMDKVIFDAIQRVEQSGIVFLDEIDKIAGRESGSGPDVSREGVQRDLLPIVEGSTVTTKYGVVKTNHILFIAAGAFSISKPSELIPELQGRFPVKVDVNSLNKEEMRRILIEPENSMVKQYQQLLGTEGIVLKFSADALEALADLAEQANNSCEDIGARRLHTIMELLLEDVSFHASQMGRQTVEVTGDYVRQRVSLQAIEKAENVRKKGKVGFTR